MVISLPISADSLDGQVVVGWVDDGESFGGMLFIEVAFFRIAPMVLPNCS